ncbi:BspA family leucine-rich repeat surface protein [Enterococcus faecium]
MKKRILVNGLISSVLLFQPIIPIFAHDTMANSDVIISNVAAKVALGNWQKTVNGDTTILTNYIGSEKDVVIPASGDLGTTHVKITKTALRSAATSANNQSGTLTTSTNDTAGTGLVADNSTDDNPNDTTVDFSNTFKGLQKIKKILLPTLKIEAADGAKGDDGESINLNSMFEGCFSLIEVNLSSFVGVGGNGGRGGDFRSEYLFKGCTQLIEIFLGSFKGKGGIGGNGGVGNGAEVAGHDGGGYMMTGTSFKQKMYCPLAIKQVARTVNVNETYGQNEMQQNAVLRDSNTGDELTNIQGLSITAIDQSGENVPLNELTKQNGTYTVTYSYQGERVDETVVVEGGDWKWHKSGWNITLEDYIGKSNDVIIPTGKDLGYDGSMVTISAEVLKDAATNARSITTSNNGDPIIVSSDSLDKVFLEKENLEEITLNNLDTSNVQNMNAMFSGCINLTKLVLDNFDTSNVTNMAQMFYRCTNLTSLDLSSFKTNKVSLMSYMFLGCRSLTSLDLSSFDTSNVTVMRSMFANCIELTHLNLSTFNTDKVVGMQQMFYNSGKLINLDLGTFDLTNVTNMNKMFKTDQPTLLLLTVTDEKLKKYDYAGDNRTKFGIVKIDPKYGNFNGQATESLFDYTTDQLLSEELVERQLDEAKKRITFEKGAKFIQWRPEAVYSTLLEKANGVYDTEAKIEDKTSIGIQNTSTTKYIGEVYGETELRANISSLTDIEGLDVLVQDRGKVTITAKDQANQSVALDDLTKKVGNYTITYSYNGKTVEEKLTVEDSYYMIIPKEYHFDDSGKNQKLKGNIKMASMSDPTKEYSGNQCVELEITSAKNFTFDNEGEYKLTSENNVLAEKDNIAKFQLGKGYTFSKEVNAQLVKKGKKIWSTDCLTFFWKSKE